MSTVLRDPAVAREWPCASLHKTSTAFDVEVESPGFGPDELEVEVEGHKLLVCAKPERGHEGRAFTFAFDIPADADVDRLHAEFADGVLTVTAPVVHRTAKRCVEIERPHLINAAACGG